MNLTQYICHSTPKLHTHIEYMQVTFAFLVNSCILIKFLTIQECLCVYHSTRKTFPHAYTYTKIKTFSAISQNQRIDMFKPQKLSHRNPFQCLILAESD